MDMEFAHVGKGIEGSEEVVSKAHVARQANRGNVLMPFNVKTLCFDSDASMNH
jgi:hypothetical protein